MIGQASAGFFDRSAARQNWIAIICDSIELSDTRALGIVNLYLKAPLRLLALTIGI
jgi:hypothetical protein